MTQETAEYKSMERFVTADKRYRKFVYALSFIFFLLVVAGGYQVQQNIENKIDGLVEGAVTRSNQRSEESKTISRETIRYTTCIFIIPLEQRTPDTQQKCFEAADLPGGLTRGDFSPLVIPEPVAATGVSVAPGQSFGPSISSSSTNSTPQTSTTQPNTSQPTTASPQSAGILQQASNFITGVLGILF